METDRDILAALMASVIDPSRAAALPASDQTVTVARHHRLSPLLSLAAGPSLPARLAELFRRDRLQTVTRNLIFTQAAEPCIRALVDDGIPTVVLKGLAYEQLLYQGAGARPTSDIDLLIPLEHRRRAFAVLDRLGFEPRAAAPGFDDADYHEVAWTKDSVEVDLHLALAPLARCDIDYAAVWAEAEPFRLGRTDALVLRAGHAAIFHALHMAIDHFDVPAIYLVDLARLLPTVEGMQAAFALARRWRCWRPLATAVSLAAALLPQQPAWRNPPPVAAFSRGVVDSYGATGRLPRPAQLVRKAAHFDTPLHAARYIVVQSRRNLRELYERRVGRRTARERLGLGRR